MEMTWRGCPVTQLFFLCSHQAMAGFVPDILVPSCHIFTFINEPLSYSECYLSHGEGESVKRWVTKQSRPSRRTHRGSLNKQWPHDAANRREFSAIIMQNHSQDTSQIWISLFISLQCSAAKRPPNLAKSIVTLPLGPGGAAGTLQDSVQPRETSEAAFLLHSFEPICCQANTHVTHLKPLQPACP